MRFFSFILFSSLFTLLFLVSARGAEPPVIPVGLDAYRQWERWPYQRIGARAYMRSTYDRTGGNAYADAGHFLYQEADDFNVTLDVAGAGVLYFARYNHWHGSPWHYEVDGVGHIVQESSTADPNKPVDNSVFLPEKLFPAPLNLTWSVTKGANLMWTPIPFERSFRMAYSRTHYGTGYYIYHQFTPGAKLSQPIVAWDGKTPPARDVLDLINRAGTDLVPASSAKGKGSVTTPINIDKLQSTRAIELKGPRMIRALEFSIPRDQAVAFGKARLRITWDGRAEPSVDAPVALFFGAGTLYNRDNKEYLVKAFPVYIRFEKAPKDRVHLACFFPMPFFKSARVELTPPPGQTLGNITGSIRAEPFSDARSQVGYFHATYRDHPEPELGQDIVLLDTRKIEGSEDWSGSFVGTSFIFSDRGALEPLEGDPRFFFDDSQTPQGYGTGTEEWGGGGDWWKGGFNTTLPFAGHPVGARNAKVAKNDEDKIQSAYRFLLADLMPFGKNAIIRLEHGGWNESTEHYQTVAFWYGAPAPSLIKTDTLKIGDEASEAAHRYVSPQASAPYSITSRYEWGVDTNPKTKQVYFPAHTDVGRKTTGASEFTLKLDPANLGVMLRRTLDYSFPNQRAEVFVSAVVDNPAESDWKPAGIWYLAGANTCVASHPKEELGATEHIVQTSNRRFRDDEFLLPRGLTAGKGAVRIRVKFTPVNRPLFPGHPMAELAWSEIRYDAYCYVMPKWEPGKK